MRRVYSAKSERLLVAANAPLAIQRDLLAALAVRHAVSTIYPYRLHVEASGLMRNGPNLAGAYRCSVPMPARILKGEKPADLPV
jgi:putative ABC transport system substrate-binding protein